MIFCCINKNFERMNQFFDNDSENQEVLLTSNTPNNFKLYKLWIDNKSLVYQ